MRPAIVALAALVLSLAAAAPAIAGGFAVTTLDQLPPDLRAGQTYAIGYTIRQHGTTPVNVEATEIRVTSPNGAKTLRYPGVQQGAVGHYVAAVIFPYDGTWTWDVTQGWFAPQSLGPVSVRPSIAVDAPAAGTAAAQAPGQATQPNALLVAALLLASAGAAILFGSRLATFANRRTPA